jgi:tetratricopeptide (TPR) repeat protein
MLDDECSFLQASTYIWSMQTIEIRQTTGFDAIVSIAGSEFEIVVSDPFAENDEKLLGWYFETWIQFPFSDGTIAKRAADSVRSYGEALFRQVFGDADAYAAYKSLKISELEILIKGEPEFQGLHWEAMRDPKGARPLAIDCVIVRQRRVKGRASTRQIEPSTVLNLLIVTARPNEENDVGYRTISRPMVEAIRDGQLPVNVEIVRPGTYKAFLDHLEAKPEGFYHVVHFDLHGGLMEYGQFQKYVPNGEAYLFQRGDRLAELPEYAGVKAFLFFEGEEAGQAVPVTAKEIAGELQDRGISVCILNACQSGKQVQPSDPLPESQTIDDRETSLGARLMDAGIQMVVAMGYSVTVDAAKVLMRRVYGELFGGKGLSEALRLGRRELFDRKARTVYFNQQVDLEDWLLPVVYGNQSIEFRLREMTFAESDAYFANQGTEYRFAGATYGFVGRDLDILKLEKGLLRHSVMLVQGMGGTGKTTLLRYLQDWWVQTGFAERVFYFGYDVKAWTLEQMCFAIASEIFSDVEMRQFQAMQLAARVGKLVQVLRSRRFGLMLDNLESVTAEALAIQNTLSVEERGRVREFLDRISGGRSIVLLGSRSREEWLRSAFRENRYELRGLDREARSQLAKLVLERHVSDRKKREAILADKEFERLMRVLAGYPLAIEVVLANLKTQSVEQVLTGLDLGDGGLDSGSGDKTESILKCVEYSHSNLSEEAQKLLLCLAPFSGFVHRELLGSYAQELQKLEPFQDYAFEQLDAAVQEAIDWGLLAPMFEGEPRLLSIQPVFPYFLKTKLFEQDETTREALWKGFKSHYVNLSSLYHQAIESTDAQEQQSGVLFCKVEYENLHNALQICLGQQDSISIFACLDRYFLTIQDMQSSIALAEEVHQATIQYFDRWNSEPGGSECCAVVLNLIGNCYVEAKQYNKAKGIHLQVLQILGTTDNSYLQSNTYHQLGRVSEGLQDYNDARINYQQALQIKKKINSRYEQAVTYEGLGSIAYKLQQHEAARINYQQALNIFGEFNDFHEQIRIYHQLGYIAQNLDDYEEARANYLQALKICLEFKDRHAQARTHHNLGIIAQEMRNYEETYLHYQEALKILIEFNDRHSQGLTYHQLGSVAQELGEFEEAHANYQQALQIFVEFNDLHNQANTHCNLGLLSGMEGNTSEAKASLQTAMDIFTEFGDDSSMTMIQQVLDQLSD